MNLTLEEKFQRFKEIVSEYEHVQGFIPFIHKWGTNSSKEYLNYMLPILFEDIPQKILYELVDLYEPVDLVKNKSMKNSTININEISTEVLKEELIKREVNKFKEIYIQSTDGKTISFKLLNSEITLTSGTIKYSIQGDDLFKLKILVDLALTKETV